MGYDIYYDVSLYDKSGRGNVGEVEFSEIVNAFEETLKFAPESTFRTETVSHICLGSLRWHTMTWDMSAISKRFPDAVFEVFCDGEDSEDKWFEYWHDGKVQIEFMEFAPYNPRKLQKPVGEQVTDWRNCASDVYRGKRDTRKNADELFEVSETELAEFGRIASGMITTKGLLRKNHIQLALKIREAYDAENVDALFKIFTGCDMAEMIDWAKRAAHPSDDIDSMF